MGDVVELPRQPEPDVDEDIVEFLQEAAPYVQLVKSNCLEGEAVELLALAMYQMAWADDEVIKFLGLARRMIAAP